MLAGAAELALARGKLSSRYWHLTVALALVVSGFASLVHEQNSWLFSRSAFIHHTIGWVMVAGAVFPLARTFRPRSFALGAGFAATFLVVAVLLYAHRDVAPIFGHLSPVAGEPHR
jgi:peptidoglycan/LPS O-acetylase OafA/YrhL